jgi:hypothetical protein
VPQYRRFSREEITTLADPVRCANDENNDEDHWEEEEEGEKEKGEEEQDEVDEEEEPICSLPKPSRQTRVGHPWVRYVPKTLFQSSIIRLAESG